MLLFRSKDDVVGEILDDFGDQEQTPTHFPIVDIGIQIYALRLDQCWTEEA